MNCLRVRNKKIIMSVLEWANFLDSAHWAIAQGAEWVAKQRFYFQQLKIIGFDFDLSSDNDGDNEADDGKATTTTVVATITINNRNQQSYSRRATVTDSKCPTTKEVYKNQNLGAWTREQRVKHKLRQEGRTATISDERIARLN
jgi:hypothetical protein